MASSVVERTTRRVAAARPAPVSIHPTERRESVVLVIDGNERRRRRQARALATLPCRVVHARASAGAIDRAASEPLAVVVLDGRDDPASAVTLARRIRARRPWAALVLVGLESSVPSLLAAANELRVFRLLPADVRDSELRRAAHLALRSEAHDRALSRLDRAWIRALVRQIEASMPRAMLARVEERGGDLPVDLIVRPTRS